jgi:hypothetical protein
VHALLGLAGLALRSDEAMAPIQTVEVDRPISQVEITWTPGRIRLRGRPWALAFLGDQHAQLG